MDHDQKDGGGEAASQLLMPSVKVGGWGYVDGSRKVG